MANFGFVYCLGNDYMPDTYKIGMTERSPTQRSLELSSSTGVPEAFKLLCYGEAEEPLLAEREVHKYFQDYRVNQSREFFNCNYESISEVIEDYCLNFVETEHGAHIRQINHLYDEFIADIDPKTKMKTFVDLANLTGIFIGKKENHVYMNGDYKPINQVVRSLYTHIVSELNTHLIESKPSNISTLLANKEVRK